MADPQAPVSVSQLRQHIAKELRRGKSQDDLVRYLGTRGWPEVTARPFVASAAQFNELLNPQPSLQPNSTAQPADAYKQRMIRGVLWILAGLGLFIVTNDITRFARSTGLVFIFAIVFGCVDFGLGLRGWLQHRK